MKEIIEELLKTITKTVDGYPVKGLKWREIDNIIIGQVKCPIIGNPNLHNGYISCTWKRNGKATNQNKGREDFELNIWKQEK